MQVSTHRVVTVRSPNTAADAAVLAVALATKNLRNAELFIVRNVMTAYAWSKERQALELRPELHANQLDCLASLNAALTEVSAERELRGKEPLEQLGPVVGSQALNTALTQSTLLTRAVRLHQTSLDVPDFTAVPAVFAHPVSKLVAGLVKETIKARVRHFKDAKLDLAGKRGVPSLPAYLGKNERRSFDLDANYLGKEGSLPQLLSNKHSLRTSFGGAELDEGAIQAWNALSLASLIDTEAQKLTARLRGQGAAVLQPVFRQLRFTVKGQVVKWQLVYELQQYVALGSALGRFRADYALRHPGKDLDKLSPAALDAEALGYVKAHPERFTRAAGLDLGVSNHATLATSEGGNLVFSGELANRQLTRMAERLDGVKSRLQEELLPQVLRDKLEANRLQLDKAQRAPLALAEKALLRQASAALHQHPAYLRVLSRLQRLKSNYLHQLSSAIVAQCQRKRVQLLVIGRNKGWKDEVELGRKMNRLFTSIAHHELIEKLKYKGEQVGLLVVDIEESYTSKMSFVHHDPMPVKNVDEQKTAASGIRAGRFYKLKTRPPGVKHSTVHADLNGSFNILRKAVSNFRYQPSTSLGFALRAFQGTWRPFDRGLANSTGHCGASRSNHLNSASTRCSG